MELERVILVSQCFSYILSVLGGLLVVIPLALNGSHFKGRCLLFTQGFWKQENGTGADEINSSMEDSIASPRLVVQQWGPLAACQFTTFVAVFTVLFGAVQTWRSLFYLHKGHDDHSCEDAQYTNLQLDVDTSAFYTQFGIAQFGLWCISVLWISLAILSFLKVYRNYKHQELGHCLAREKELLLDRSCRTRVSSPQKQQQEEEQRRAPSVFI
ncbi:transmembrane protein 179-like isoform X2 [Erpetoichthys calabaricus]|uniref:transmembrane protein 179-like isoform X2 n=1 Tax=Erpetoichthys calabaricus TaxID=27687 RepID=UPI00109F861E|nr:transmembrane protein 179-like isoform X2 [Erpetoichthys calabaricus]XP_039616671.1 transmembrane protein 179 isoform X2 [Polypterus senegalus]